MAEGSPARAPLVGPLGRRRNRMRQRANRLTLARPAKRCSRLAALSSMAFAVALFSLAALSPSPATAELGTAGGCIPPAIDGNLSDLESFATCLAPADGCGFVVVDPEKDICAPNQGFIPCNPSEACPAGGSAIYFANGADLIRVIFAYDRN